MKEINFALAVFDPGTQLFANLSVHNLFFTKSKSSISRLEGHKLGDRIVLGDLETLKITPLFNNALLKGVKTFSGFPILLFISHGS